MKRNGLLVLALLLIGAFGLTTMAEAQVPAKPATPPPAWPPPDPLPRT